MRHEDEGDALRAQLFDDDEQTRDLTLGEGGRRLVHDEELRVAGQGAADGGELLVCDGELFDVGVERERDAEALDDLRGLLFCVRGAEELLLFRDRGGHHDVLGDRQVREQAEVLVDDLDAGVHGAERRQRGDGVAVDEDASRVGRVHSGDDFDESGLSAAILAGQAQHFTRPDGHVDAIEGANTAEVLDDIPNL